MNITNNHSRIGSFHKEPSPSVKGKSCSKSTKKAPRPSLCKTITAAVMGALLFFSGKASAATPATAVSTAHTFGDLNGMCSKTPFFTPPQIERDECHLEGMPRSASTTNLLGCDLFDAAKKAYFEESSGNVGSLEKAKGGRKSVYLPNDLPLVFKELHSNKQLDQMEQASQICHRNNYRHLEIPDSALLNSFIIQKRVPFKSIDSKHQIALYLENIDLFTNAAREFTGFLCQGYLGDITTETGSDPYENLFNKEKEETGRYDNIVLYTEHQEGRLTGKVGFVDLDGFGKLGKYQILEQVKNAIRFFPHHLEVIIEEATKHYPQIVNHRGQLEIFKDQTLKFFQGLAGDHLTFLKQKDITRQNPSALPTIPPDQKAAQDKSLQQFLFKKTLELYQGKNRNANFSGARHALKWFLEKENNPPKTITSDYIQTICEKGFPPEILDLARQLVSDKLKNNVGNKQAASLGELSVLRTFDFNHYDSQFCEIASKISSLIGCERALAKDFVDFIFEGMAELGECAYFNPQFGFTKIFFC